jgi:hypothetical protein
VVHVAVIVLVVMAVWTVAAMFAAVLVGTFLRRVEEMASGRRYSEQR